MTESRKLRGPKTTLRLVPQPRRPRLTVAQQRLEEERKFAASIERNAADWPSVVAESDELIAGILRRTDFNAYFRERLVLAVAALLDSDARLDRVFAAARAPRPRGTRTVWDEKSNAQLWEWYQGSKQARAAYVRFICRTRVFGTLSERSISNQLSKLEAAHKSGDVVQHVEGT